MLQKHKTVKTGLDVLEEEQFKRLRTAKLALLGHPASVNRNLEHIYDLLIKADLKVVHLFGPEHGFFGCAQDMEPVKDASLKEHQIPVTSLYGETRKSLLVDESLLRGVDILVCDLQDIGSRYYTFAYTLAFALIACAKAGIKCMVIDRPNPISSKMAGNRVRDSFKSFVGEYPLPIQHGLTVGELALFFKEHDGLNVDLEIVPVKNWQRDQYFDETGLPFVLPSPNMPNLEAALLYPGLCLIEGTNLSEGRGTTRPFELIGAPYIDDPASFASLASKDISGAHLRPCWFKPMFQKHSEKMCGGVQIHITDRSRLDPIHLGLSIISAARKYENFDWRREPYEFVSDRLAIDLLMGDDTPRKMFENGNSPSEIYDYLNKDIATTQSFFSKYRNPDYSW